MTKSLAVWLGCGWLALAQVPDPVREAVERGLAAEESGKDLAGATKAYTDAVAAADARRATHATALFRLAEVQRLQGRTNEATELYRRLLVEFPDQSEMVAVARRHAGAVAVASGGEGGPLAMQRLRMRQQDLLQAERDLAQAEDRLFYFDSVRPEERLNWLAREVPTVAAGVNTLKAMLASQKQELIKLESNLGPGHPDRVAQERVVMALEAELQSIVPRGRQSLESEITFRKGRLSGLGEQVKKLEAEAAASSVSPVRPTVGPASEAERLLEDEIRVAEQQLSIEQRKFEAGRVGEEEVLKARREVLGLKRQLAEKRQRRDILDPVPSGGSSKAETPKVQAAAAPDEEAAEIARLQGLYRNSPDLLNQSGTDGTPLEKAARQGHTRVVAHLLGEGMPTRSEESLRGGLKVAASAGRLDVCRMLLDAGADPNRVDAGGGLPLLRAAYAGHRAVVELLLDRGAKVDGNLERDTQEIAPGTQFRKGANALFMAVYGRRMAVLELLLQRGASPNGVDGSGVTPLASAIFRKWEDGALRLLEAGADPDLGYALHCACSSMPSLIRPLLEAGADPNRMPEKNWMMDQDNGGTWQQPWLAPLHILASRGGPTEELTALLDAGAFVNAGNEQGWTAFDLAFGRPEVRSLLQARGGRSTAAPQPSGVFARLPRSVSAVVCGAMASEVPGVGPGAPPGAPRSPGQTQQQPPPLRLAQFLQQIVSIETNTPGLAPVLSRVVVTRREPANAPSAQSVGGARTSPNIRGYKMVLDPVTGQTVRQVDSEAPETVTTNDVAAILASGDASKDIEIPVDGFTRIYVPFKPRPKVERPVRKPASVVAPKGTGLVTVLGAVQRPGNVELVPGKPMDLVQVIAASGGLARDGSRNRIVLRRGKESRLVDLDKAMSERVPVEPGDIIEVKQPTF